MSDEASGPDEEDETSKAMWKTRMAFKSGYENLTTNDGTGNVEFLEVMDCERRTEEMAAALHEMATIAFDDLTPRQRNTFKFRRVRNTGRRPTCIPDRAPYNFGINGAWFDKNKDHPDYRELLVDWNTYPDPQGFGMNKHAVGEAGMGEIGVGSNLEDNTAGESNAGATEA
ncbi:hypothetical protein B0H13DRAFT_2312912 [Mycena leptocephala]|nr:hypothetical protein B0H13DRAFT_2312912 [Mycena leptocephala]